MSSCIDLAPSQSGDNTLQGGAIERDDGESEKFVPPPSNSIPPRLDNSFLDQYFSNFGLCEIKLRTCSTGYVQIPNGTEDYFNFQFYNLSHAGCLEKGLEYEEGCQNSDDVVVTFSSPYDKVVSSTTVGGIELFSNNNFTCELEFTSCLNGGAYAKFDLLDTTRSQAVKDCLQFTSDRSIGCAGGVLKRFKVNSTFGFNFTHIHHHQDNYQVLNECNNSDETIDVVVDYRRSYLPNYIKNGFEFGFDYANTSNSRNDSQNLTFRENFINDAGLRFYRTSADDEFSTIRMAKELHSSGHQIQVVIGRTPSQYIPVGEDSTIDMEDGIPLYTHGSIPADTGFNAMNRLINGEVGQGGVISAINNMDNGVHFPDPRNIIVEPWDAPDHVFADVLQDTYLCPNNLKAGCNFHYGDEIAAPWKGGGFITLANATAAQILDYTYSAHETYVRVFQEVINQSGFGATDFAGPSIENFNKTYLRGFMDYCLARKKYIQNTLPADRGCEVNYITWHGSDYYEDQMSQLMRDVEWVRKEFIENSKYDLLNIKGIIITHMGGKRDFFVPSAAFRQMIYHEYADVSFSSRSCWFRTCEGENTLGGMLNFQSSGSSLATRYEETNMWWTNKFYDESVNNRVRAYTFSENIGLLASLRAESGKPEVWLGSHFKDGKKRNVRILFQNLQQIPGYNPGDVNLKISGRKLVADYNNFWTSEEAFNFNFDQFSPKYRGPSIVDSDLQYETLIEIPILKSDASVCIPNQYDGDLNNYVIDFSPIAP